MFDKLKLAVSHIVGRLSAPEKATIEATRKLDRGIFPEHDTVAVGVIDKKEITFASILPHTLEKVTNRFIGGLMGMFAHGQIWVDAKLRHSIVPDFEVVQAFRSKADSDAFVAKSKQMRSKLQTLIEDTLNVWILPVAAGNEFKWHGKIWVKMLFLKKNGHKTIKTAIAARFEELRGVLASRNTVDKMVKMLSYLTTPIYHKSFFMNVMVIDNSWCIKPESLDGSAMHFPNKDVLIHHDERNFDVTLNNVLHVRGLPTGRSGKNSGSIFKGTSKPVTYHQVKMHIHKPFQHIVIKALEMGWMVCTGDVFKSTPPGRYHHMEMWWHNASNQISFWQDIKLCFPQWAIRRIFTDVRGLVKLIALRVKDLGEAMKNTKTLVKYILKNKEIFNDENTPTLSIVEGLVQVLNGRPFGLHRSDEFNVMRPMCRMLKALTEVRIGTRNMKHWNAEEHLGLGARAFVMGDPELVEGEFGVPNFAMHMAIKTFDKEKVHVVEENAKKYMTIDGYSNEARRHPQSATSALPCRIVVRNDDFAYFTLPAEDMDNFGADFDGDKMEWVCHPTELYTIEDVRQSNIDRWPEPDVDVSKLMPERPAIADIPKHHNANYEREAADPIGIVHFFIEQVGHYLFKRGIEKHKVLRVTNKLETGPLATIVNGKKHDIANVVHLPEMQRKQAALNMKSPGRGYRIINNKVDFSTEFVYDADNSTHKLTLQEFPHWLKKQIGKTWLTQNYPIHETLFKAIIKFFPESVADTRCTDEHVNKDKLNEIIAAMFNNFHEVLQTKMKFDINHWGDIKHEVLDKFFDRIMQKIKSNSPNVQEWISNAIPKVWEMIMRPLKTDEDRAIAELFLMAYAFKTRSPKTGASIHGFIFTHVSGVAFKEFIQLLYGADWHEPDEFVHADHDGEDFPCEYDDGLVSLNNDQMKDINNILGK